MIIAGLTGGIASGKSTVAAIFKRAGAAVIDADLLAREVVRPGQPAWYAIREQFGQQVLHPDETINRAKLGQLVFRNAQLRHRLERIIHPQVRIAMHAEVDRIRQAEPHAVIIEDIPLLYESGMTAGLAEIIVVYIPRTLQLRRLMQRDRIGIEAAWARIHAQMPIEEKCQRATIVINNSGSPTATHAQARKVYTDLARQAGSCSSKEPGFR